MAKQLHVILNSHIDPVWIWDRPSGRSVWLNTMRSTVTLLEEFKDAKFTCSSTALYRWLKETDPGLFRRIVQLAEEGRWENVGGWEVQSDALISRTETPRSSLSCSLNLRWLVEK